MVLDCMSYTAMVFVGGEKIHFKCGKNYTSTTVQCNNNEVHQFLTLIVLQTLTTLIRREGLAMSNVW